MCGVIAGVSLLAGCSPKPATVPTSFTRYTSLDSAFLCDAPAGWKAESSGQSGGTESSVVFTSGDGRISIDADQSGSFMGDAMTGPGAMIPGATPQVPPVEKLHSMTGQKFAQDLSGYTEIATDPKPAAYGQCRLTEYTADKVHGYRVTMLGTNRRVSIVCRCSPTEWQALNGAFLHVIQSVTPGSAM